MLRDNGSWYRMRIGCAESDCTPDMPVVLAGQPFAVQSEGVESPLHVRALWIEDEPVRVLILAVDGLGFPDAWARDLRRELADACRLPEAHILLTATHTHSAPSVIEILGSAADRAYADALRKTIVETARRARASAAAGSIRAAAGTAPGWGFNRRFLMSDGTVETHPLKGNPHIVGPEGPDAERLFVLEARTEEGRSLGAIMNFGCHATVMERRNRRISADYPGAASGRLSALLPGRPLALFLQGAAGNICPVDPRNPDRREVGAAWAHALGHGLAERAGELLRGASVASGPLRAGRVELTLARREAGAELLAWAQRQAPPGGEIPELDDYGADRFDALPADRLSLADFMKTRYWAGFHAREILGCEAARRRNPDVPFEIVAVAQGDWALVFLPCELFVEWGNAIAAQSPYRHTGVVTLVNGICGYIPTETAFARAGGYETKLLSSSYLEPGAGARVVQATLGLLRELVDRFSPSAGVRENPARYAIEDEDEDENENEGGSTTKGST